MICIICNSILMMIVIIIMLNSDMHYIYIHLNNVVTTTTTTTTTVIIMITKLNQWCASSVASPCAVSFVEYQQEPDHRNLQVAFLAQLDLDPGMH